MPIGMWTPGPLEIVIVLVIVLVIFGPKRLPDLGKSLGRGMREFKDSVSREPKVETRSELPPPVPAPPPAPTAEETTATPSSSERESEPPAAASA